MNNAERILQMRIHLMENGVIGTTGKKITVEDESGEEREVLEPAVIHTYAGWKALGYRVKRGEHACATFPIWRHKEAGKKKDKTTGEISDTPETMFMTNAKFFSEIQVEKIPEESK